MLIKLNTLPDFLFDFPAGLAPTRYWVVKQGYTGGQAPAVAGAGTFSTFYNGSGAQYQYKIQLAAGETDTLGSLAIVADDFVAQSRVVGIHQVVAALPGEVIDVNNVQGDVQGIVEEIAAAQRILIGTDFLNTVDTVELGLNVRDCLRVIFAQAAGIDSVLGNVVRFRNFGNTKTRITATVDPVSRERTSVTHDFS